MSFVDKIMINSLLFSERFCKTVHGFENITVTDAKTKKIKQPFAFMSTMLTFFDENNIVQVTMNRLKSKMSNRTVLCKLIGVSTNEWINQQDLVMSFLSETKTEESAVTTDDSIDGIERLLAIKETNEITLQTGADASKKQEQAITTSEATEHDVLVELAPEPTANPQTDNSVQPESNQSKVKLTKTQKKKNKKALKIQALASSTFQPEHLNTKDKIILLTIATYYGWINQENWTKYPVAMQIMQDLLDMKLFKDEHVVQKLLTISFLFNNEIPVLQFTMFLVQTMHTLLELFLKVKGGNITSTVIHEFEEVFYFLIDAVVHSKIEVLLQAWSKIVNDFSKAEKKEVYSHIYIFDPSIIFNVLVLDPADRIGKTKGGKKSNSYKVPVPGYSSEASASSPKTTSKKLLCRAAECKHKHKYTNKMMMYGCCQNTICWDYFVKLIILGKGTYSCPFCDKVIRMEDLVAASSLA